ncbi:hypothetical protein VPHD148_0241 [Vibrio phage D148]
MEKNSSIVLSETEKAQVRGGQVPERFVGWYTLQELLEHV